MTPLAQIVEMLAEHEQAILYIASLVVSVSALYWRLKSRIDSMETHASRERTAIATRLDKVEVTLEHIDDNKMPRNECLRSHMDLAEVINSFKAEIRSMHGTMTELAMLVRRNGSGGH